MKERDYHAALTVYGLGSMDKRMVKRLIRWLRDVAADIEKEGAKAYSSGRYNARLMK